MPLLLLAGGRPANALFSWQFSLFPLLHSLLMVPPLLYNVYCSIAPGQKSNYFMPCVCARAFAAAKLTLIKGDLPPTPPQKCYRTVFIEQRCAVVLLGSWRLLASEPQVFPPPERMTTETATSPQETANAVGAAGPGSNSRGGSAAASKYRKNDIGFEKILLRRSTQWE